jgi:hypothetical protein
VTENKKEWVQMELPETKKMVEELYNPDEGNKVKQYQVKEEDEKREEISSSRTIITSNNN